MYSLSPKLMLFSLLLMSLPAHAQQSGSSASRPRSLAQGVLAPWKSCRVAFAESGLIEQFFVSPGSKVSVGQPLATLDAELQRIVVKMAQIQAEAHGKLQSATAEVELHRRKLSAIENGRRQNFATPSELERAQAELQVSEGKLATERDQFAVEQLNLAKLQFQLQQRTVTAPIGGTVVRLLREVGEFVSPTSPEVMEIVDTSKLRATFFLTAGEVRSLKGMTTVSVLVDQSLATPAKLEFVAPVADGESGLIEIRLLIENPDGEILGSSCSLDLGLNDSHQL